MGWFEDLPGEAIHTPEANKAFMARATPVDSLVGAGEFTNAFKKSWASGERILPNSFGHAGKQGALGALAGAGIAAYDQRDITAPASLNGVTNMAIGAGAAIGGVMAWKFGKRLKTSIFTSLSKESTPAAEAAEKAKDIISGRSEVIGSFTE